MTETFTDHFNRVEEALRFDASFWSSPPTDENSVQKLRVAWVKKCSHSHLLAVYRSALHVQDVNWRDVTRGEQRVAVSDLLHEISEQLSADEIWDLVRQVREELDANPYPIPSQQKGEPVDDKSEESALIEPFYLNHRWGQVDVPKLRRLSRDELKRVYSVAYRRNKRFELDCEDCGIGISTSDYHRMMRRGGGLIRPIGELLGRATVRELSDAIYDELRPLPTRRELIEAGIRLSSADVDIESRKRFRNS